MNQSLLSIGHDIYRRHGFVGLSGAALDYLSRPAVMPFAIRALRRAADRAATPDDVVDVALGFRLANIDITPMQVRSEIVGLAEEVGKLRPETVLEIGTARGGTLFVWAQLAAAHARLISVDLPFGSFGGGYPAYKVPLYRSFAREGQTIELLRGNSHDPETVSRVRRQLDDRPVDYLFIDGDHSYEGVSADFETYGGLVRPGGLIAFHDVVPGAPDAVGGVPDFWRDLKARRPGDCVEFVENWDQGGLGIGLVRVPPNA